MSGFLINPYRFGTALDSNAATYIAAVELADGQSLEHDVKTAINSFVITCKADGNWAKIKACCILAGARTLSGALVPLVGTAPTNNNFVSGDYNRKTGLRGNASNKYLDSNRNNNADPQNDCHLAVYATRRNASGNRGLIGRRSTGSSLGAKTIDITTSVLFASVPSIDGRDTGSAWANNVTTFAGFSRSASGSYTSRNGGTNTNQTRTSGTPNNGNIWVFGVNNGGSLQSPTESDIMFYSIGESLTLASFDSAITTLVNAFAAAIP